MAKSTIKPEHYNHARSTLAQAGSHSAAKSHVKHAAEGDVPEGHGKSLLGEARDEFQRTDQGHPEIHKAGMTKPHYDAIHKAAEQMGLGAPKGPRNGRPKETKWRLRKCGLDGFRKSCGASMKPAALTAAVAGGL